MLYLYNLTKREGRTSVRDVTHSPSFDPVTQQRMHALNHRNQSFPAILPGHLYPHITQSIG